ncbi:hypothetical protein BOX15_Mlig025444g1, partial [Macrostomum lignano]
RFGGSEADVGQVRSLEELRAELEATYHHEQQTTTDVAGFLTGTERKGEPQHENVQWPKIPETGQTSREESIAVPILIENANGDDTPEAKHENVQGPKIPETGQISREECIAVSIVIENVNGDDAPESRPPGYKADRRYIRAIAKKLGCTDEPIQFEQSDDRSKQELLDFIKEKYLLLEARVRVLLLFISSHGNEEEGFSTGKEHVQLKELLGPLSSGLNESEKKKDVLIFYHACRGTQEHFEKQEDPVLDSGAVDGASLPLELRRNCSVIYSSQSGYASRWQEKDGSRLFMALWDVICSKDYSFDNDIAGLAQKVQNKLNSIDGDGIEDEINGKVKKCYPRVAYTDKINNANNNVVTSTISNTTV